MKPTLIITENEGVHTAELSGDLTLRYHKEIRKIFDRMAKSHPKKLIINNPDHIDLVFLQLLWSYIKTMKLSGRKIELSSTLPESEEQLLKRLNLFNLI